VVERHGERAVRDDHAGLLEGHHDPYRSGGPRPGRGRPDPPPGGKPVARSAVRRRSWAA
jgi:hypothetical protein